jgi:N-acyl-D-aspartate/D-glutamate deacylase
MRTNFLIKGGIVVDGTGAPSYKADVRVRGNLIAEIKPDIQPEPRERVVDASGCYVTPGFIESHNHFDGPMWWQPTLDPMPGYGITTSINGNCGFAAAPVHEDPVVRKEMIDIFCFFEDIPPKPFYSELPWDWRSWSEYKNSLVSKRKFPVNIAAFVGHIAIRLAVMGMDAWERAATPAEIEKMCWYLRDALDAGAIGMSSNQLDHDRRNRPIPSMLADDAEYSALLNVLAEYPGVTFQVIVDHFMRFTGPATTERMGNLAKAAGVRMQWAGLPTLEFQSFIRPASEALHEKFKAEGLDFWTGYHHISPTTMISFRSSLVFAQSNNYVWNEIIEAKTEDEKLALLADPAWRARARESWEQTFDQSPLKYPDQLILRDSETQAGPVNVTLDEYMKEIGAEHPSDALADWLLVNGIDSNLFLISWKRDEEVLMRMLKDPRSVGNISDAGAHSKMFCGAGDNIWLLTEYVRDRKMLTIEEGVHVMTGKSANFFGLTDRGVIKPGKRADIAVFNLDEVERRPEIKVWDVPDGEGASTFRYSRAAAPMRLTLVNGEATFENGSFTGRFPGEFVSVTAPTALAQAAE